MDGMKKLVPSLAITFGILSCMLVGPAGAVPVVLGFEGLQNLEPIQGFYNGGTGGFGSGPGTNFGISFSGDTQAIIDADAGGTGQIGGEPSPDTVLFFLQGTAVLNFATGFTSFSLFYSAVLEPGSIDIYDGLDKTGNVLAHLNLPMTPFNGAPDPTGFFSPFVFISDAFVGIAKSIDFGGTADQIAFDDITLDSVTPGSQVPEPSTLFLLGTGLAGVAWGARRRTNV